MGEIFAAAAFFATLAVLWRFTPLADSLTFRNIASWASIARGQWCAPFALIGREKAV